jgi:hypothetical protein
MATEDYTHMASVYAAITEGLVQLESATKVV